MSDEGIKVEKEYKVGFGKPPETGKFKKGQSGNPRGSNRAARARKAKRGSFSKLFGNGLQEPVEVPENGKTVVITRLHLGIRRRVEAAAKGDLRALKELLKLRDVKEIGPLAPEMPFVFTLDEAKAFGHLGEVLHNPNCVIVRYPKPGAASETKRAPRGEPIHPRRSVGELIEIELERQIQVTDAATGEKKRMTMREIIAEQLMRLFTAGKPGTADLMIKLNKKAATDKQVSKKYYVGVPWDFEMPLKRPPGWYEQQKRENLPTEPIVIYDPVPEEEDPS